MAVEISSGKGIFKRIQIQQNLLNDFLTFQNFWTAIANLHRRLFFLFCVWWEVTLWWSLLLYPIDCSPLGGSPSISSLPARDVGRLTGSTNILTQRESASQTSFSRRQSVLQKKSKKWPIYDGWARWTCTARYLQILWKERGRDPFWVWQLYSSWACFFSWKRKPIFKFGAYFFWYYCFFSPIF